jgi:hypothetical protein
MGGVVSFSSHQKGKDRMYQTLHNEIAKASAPRVHSSYAIHKSERGRGSPPGRRVRRKAAGALALLAQRLDAERARRILA